MWNFLQNALQKEKENKNSILPIRGINNFESVWNIRCYAGFFGSLDWEEKKEVGEQRWK